jgi:transmembrane sensor
VHAEAFARVADLWEMIPGGAKSRERFARSWRARGALAAVGLLAAMVLGTARYLTPRPEYRTAIGQQQLLSLADDTRVVLNTDSRLSVNYSNRERRVSLERGEALFEVTKNANRAFIVQAGDTEVRALGTKFDVRLKRGRVIVVLLDGKVEITKRAPELATQLRVATLSPGERATVGSGVAAVDRPNVEAATAWRRGEAMFEDATLPEAVVEMNRYARVQVMLADPGLERLRVSGVFESQSAEEFAESMAALHHLRLERRGNALILSAAAAPN